MSFARHSRSEAVERVPLFVPDGPAGDKVLQCLASAVRLANDVAPGAWAVTLLERTIRITFGPVEVFRITADHLWIAAVGLGVAALPPGLGRGSTGLKKLGDAEAVVGPAADVAEVFSRLEGPFLATLELLAAQSTKNLNAAARTAHARGLLDYLDARLGESLPRPAWDAAPDGAAGLLDEAVFTAMAPSRVDDCELSINQPWARARRSFEAATKSGERMPILFGDAERAVTELVAWALVTEIVIDEGVSTIRYERVRALRDRSATELIKLSDGTRISRDYQKAYVPVRTPAFLLDEEAVAEDFEVRGVTSVEGRRRLRAHFRIERSRKLVEEAKAAWRRNDPMLRCEVCDHSFLASFGEEYIEAHHRIPLATLRGNETSSSIGDLAAVCANCHRMLHRLEDSTPEALRGRRQARGMGSDQ